MNKINKYFKEELKNKDGWKISKAATDANKEAFLIIVYGEYGHQKRIIVEYLPEFDVYRSAEANDNHLFSYYSKWMSEKSMLNLITQFINNNEGRNF